jgi:YbbR domain-containing protein
MANSSGNSESVSLFKTLVGLVTRSFWLKFLSLLFAIVLFFIVRTDKEVVYERMAKIKIVTLPNMTILGANERFLNVSVRIQNSLFSVPPTDAQLTGEVDILTNNAEKISVKVNRENFAHLPKHYSIFIERPYIEIETDKLITKELPVQAVLRGEPAPGLVVSKIDVKPELVRASGAKQEIAKLDAFTTVPINIDGIKNNFTTLAPLDGVDKTSLKFPFSSVQVTVNLVNKKFNRVFHSVPVEVFGLSRGALRKVEIRPKFIDVEVAGEKEIVRKINPSEIRAYIYGNDLRPGWQDKKISLKLPDVVSLVRMTPDTLSVLNKAEAP